MWHKRQLQKSPLEEWTLSRLGLQLQCCPCLTNAGARPLQQTLGADSFPLGPGKLLRSLPPVSHVSSLAIAFAFNSQKRHIQHKRQELAGANGEGRGGKGGGCGEAACKTCSLTYSCSFDQPT